MLGSVLESGSGINFSNDISWRLHGSTQICQEQAHVVEHRLATADGLEYCELLAALNLNSNRENGINIANRVSDSMVKRVYLI